MKLDNGDAERAKQCRERTREIYREAIKKHGKDSESGRRLAKLMREELGHE